MRCFDEMNWDDAREVLTWAHMKQHNQSRPEILRQSFGEGHNLFWEFRDENK
jgi:hypothetical protein